MTSRVLLGGLLVVVALSGFAGCRHDIAAPAQAPVPTLTMDEGVFVMRVVASVEVVAKGRETPSRYHPLADILAIRDATSLGKEVALVDSENGIYKGYALRVTAQGSRFEASLVPDKRGCGLSFFIDERILIYTGYGLGCPQKPSAPER